MEGNILTFTLAAYCLHPSGAAAGEGGGGFQTARATQRGQTDAQTQIKRPGEANPR